MCRIDTAGKWIENQAIGCRCLAPTFWSSFSERSALVEKQTRLAQPNLNLRPWQRKDSAEMSPVSFFLVRRYHRVSNSSPAVHLYFLLKFSQRWNFKDWNKQDQENGRLVYLQEDPVAGLCCRGNKFLSNRTLALAKGDGMEPSNKPIEERLHES